MTIRMNDHTTWPRIGSVWSHRNGNGYQVIDFANIQGDRSDYPTMILYRNMDNGHKYCRRLDDWDRSMTWVRDPTTKKKAEVPIDDCERNAMAREPRFTLLARDPQFYPLVMKWADQRDDDVKCGARPASDTERVKDARRIARDGQKWRRTTNGLWRGKL